MTASKHILLQSCLLMLATAGMLRADSSALPDQSLTVAGGTEALWLVVGEWDREQQRFLNWIAWMEPAPMDLRPLRVKPQLGLVKQAALWEGSLHLFVRLESNGSVSTAHYSYNPPADNRRERRLPDDALPLALAGGSSEWPGLWAVVTGQTAEAVRAEWEAYQQSQQTQPADTEQAASDKPPSVPETHSVEARPEEAKESGFHLVSYNGNLWEPGFEGPPGLRQAARIWLTFSGRYCHLFWQEQADDTSIRYARREGTDWQEMPPASFDRPAVGGVAAVLNKQLVFAALLAAEDDEGLHCIPNVLPPNGDEWIKRPPLKEAEGQAALLLPRGSVVGGFGDQLAVLRPAEPAPQVGLWSPTDGRVVMPFMPAPIHKDDATTSTSARIEELVYLLVVMGIVLLVYWRRQESVTSPAALPAGLIPAELGRRAVAALIDLAPAAIIVGVIWRVPLAAYSAEAQAAMNTGQTAPPLPTTLIWAWLWFAVLYSTWCMIFELAMRTTPGKRLLGCSVAAEGRERPTALQIVLRNALRVLELEPHLRLWPFLLVVLMTRNRQRVGDLIARTVVVQRAQEPVETVASEKEDK